MSKKVPQVTRHLPFLRLGKVSLPPLILTKVLELNHTTEHHVLGKIVTVLDAAENDEQVEVYPGRLGELVKELLADIVAVYSVIFVDAAMEFAK